MNRGLRSWLLSCGIALPATLLVSVVVCESAFPEVSRRTILKTTPILEIAQQSDPNRDRFLQPQPELPAPIREETKPTLSPPNPEPSPSPPATEQPEIRVSVRKIEVIGSTVFGSEELNPITGRLEGQSVTLEDLQRVADEITQLYVSQGYITSRAVLVEQEIIDGVVQIQVIEGRLQDIRVEGSLRLANYIKSRISLGASSPLRSARLEEQLRLLRADPLIEDIRGSLQPGDGIGESILVVEVATVRGFTANFSFDNYSPPVLGSERTGVELGYRNLLGFGDTLSGAYYRSTTGGSDILDFNYRLPLNPMDGTLQLRTFLSRSEFDSPQTINLIDEQGQIVETQTFDLEISSDYDIYEISFRQPVVRSLREEVAFSLGFSHRNGQPLEALDTPSNLQSEVQDFIESPEFFEGTDDKTSVFSFGVDYVNRDLRGAWAMRSQFNFGTGLFDATIQDDPLPDGLFFSWLFQIQRVQRLSPSNLLIVQADLQLTPNSLLPSEQFVIGGGQSLRGYRQNVRFGDNGFRLSVEDRIALYKSRDGEPIFQVAPFIDLGQVWNNPDNPVILDQTFLAGLGLGLLWEPVNNLNIRLDFTIPLVNLDDRGNNIQDDGIYFSINYRL